LASVPSCLGGQSLKCLDPSASPLDRPGQLVVVALFKQVMEHFQHALRTLQKAT
jgi:hypothetical protein